MKPVPGLGEVDESTEAASLSTSTVVAVVVVAAEELAVVIVEKLAVVERAGGSSANVSCPVGNSGSGLVNLMELWVAAIDGVDGNFGNGFWGLKHLWVSGASKADGHSGGGTGRGILWSLVVSLSFRYLSLSLLRKTFMRLKAPAGIERRSRRNPSQPGTQEKEGRAVDGVGDGDNRRKKRPRDVRGGGGRSRPSPSWLEPESPHWHNR